MFAQHLEILVSHNAKNFTITEELYVPIALELFCLKDGHMEDGIQFLLCIWNGVQTANNLLQKAMEAHFQIVSVLCYDLHYGHTCGSQ